MDCGHPEGECVSGDVNYADGDRRESPHSRGYSAVEDLSCLPLLSSSVVFSCPLTSVIVHNATGRAKRGGEGPKTALNICTSGTGKSGGRQLCITTTSSSSCCSQLEGVTEKTENSQCGRRQGTAVLLCDKIRAVKDRDIHYHHHHHHHHHHHYSSSSYDYYYYY